MSGVPLDQAGPLARRLAPPIVVATALLRKDPPLADTRQAGLPMPALGNLEHDPARRPKFRYKLLRAGEFGALEEWIRSRGVIRATVLDIGACCGEALEACQASTRPGESAAPAPRADAPA
jgi:hypothetical protein